ncbi:hypothetical protein [Streptomyces sp. GSL17-111]|uniref:hypothetical protein n=1 Tax=Streptomyces sp. GSL17-111 TaxID=3121596 RepID=UPI0030F37A87
MGNGRARRSRTAGLAAGVALLTALTALPAQAGQATRAGEDLRTAAGTGVRVTDLVTLPGGSTSHSHDVDDRGVAVGHVPTEDVSRRADRRHPSVTRG